MELRCDCSVSKTVIHVSIRIDPCFHFTHHLPWPGIYFWCVVTIISISWNNRFSCLEKFSRTFCDLGSIELPEWSNNGTHISLQHSLIDVARFQIQSVSVDKDIPSDGFLLRWLPSAQAFAHFFNKLTQLYSSAMDSRNSRLVFCGYRRI